MGRITSEKTTSSGAFPARHHKSAALIAGLALAWPVAAAAEVDCVEQMSRVPTGYSPAAAPLRAMSLRTAAAPAPAARAKPAKVAKARPAAVKRAQTAKAKAPPRVAKAGPAKPRARTAARRVAPKVVRPVAVAAADFAGPVMAVPARRAAPTPQPLGFALVSTTVCESRPNRISPVDYIVPGGGPPPFIEDEPEILPGGEPPTEPPTIILPREEPPVIGPPFPPVIGPPEEPPVIGPPTVTPPVLPPGEPPFPPGEPPPTLVPEPATWALMLTGFGLMGAALRRSKRSLASRR